MVTGVSETHHLSWSIALPFFMTRSRSRGRKKRGIRGGRRHRRSVQAAMRRATRAQARIRAVRAHRVVGRAVRRVFLGGAARSVFAMPFADCEAPEVLSASVWDIGDRLRIVPDQGVTTTGSRHVKGAGRHHCRHRWRLLMTAEGPVYVSLSTHHREGGQALPYLWVQEWPALVWRVAAMFAP